MSETRRYAAPASLSEAAELLRGGDVTLLAGGTDLMPQAKAGRLAFRPLLLSLRRIPELHGVARDGDALRIGALVTMTEMMESALVREHCPILVEAADHFASDQVRNAATIGGNVCNASPAGDTLVPLLALDAEVELVAKPNGSLAARRVPIGEFFTGPGKTVILPGEILTEILITPTGRNEGSAYAKIGRRAALSLFLRDTLETVNSPAENISWASIVATVSADASGCTSAARVVRDLNFKHLRAGKGAPVTARFGRDGITIVDPFARSRGKALRRIYRKPI
jgi:CO/xanthine dehydrogenase FAD-binding subunit